MATWQDIIAKVQQYRNNWAQHLDLIRREYLTELHNYTGRNVLAYYSGWLSRPGLILSEINDEDMSGFVACLQGIDRSKGLDLILHTPGGNISSAISIVHYLRQL